MTAGLKPMLVRHEGLRLKVYRDSRGILTIGVGRNVQDVGISLDECMLMLEHDISTKLLELSEAFPWFQKLDPIRQDALVDMSFMGVERVKDFHDMISAIQKQDWDAAAAAMLESHWAEQVHDRAKELSEMMRTGKYQT